MSDAISWLPMLHPRPDPNSALAYRQPVTPQSVRVLSPFLNPSVRLRGYLQVPSAPGTPTFPQLISAVRMTTARARR